MVVENRTGNCAPPQRRRGNTLVAAALRRALASTLIEALEPRMLLSSTFMVTTLADSGAGSLRQAILDANAAGGTDDIDFANGLAGTVTLATQLPDSRPT